jgi:hypothetical protein
MTWCARCGAPLADEARFCSACGFAVSEPVATEPVPARPPTNMLAAASLTLGLLWIWWIGSLFAVVFGTMALQQIRTSEGTEAGQGVAIAGIMLGCVGLLWLLIVGTRALAR